MQTLQEIGSLLIPLMRESFTPTQKEPLTQTTGVDLMKSLYIREPGQIEELRIHEENSSQYAATVKRLTRTEHLKWLHYKLKSRNSAPNSTLTASLQEKETVLVAQTETMLKDENIVCLKLKFQKINLHSKTSQAELYLLKPGIETAADRIKFAPKKKKKPSVKHSNFIGCAIPWEIRKLKRALQN